MVSYLTETGRLLRLAWPILVAQIAMTTMGFIDTVMAGNVSATDMAAVAVASSFWIPAILLVQGLVMALTPIVAQLNGARKRSRIPLSVMQGLWLVAFLCPPVMLVLYFSPLLLGFMDVEPELVRLTEGYLHAVLWGLPPFAFYLVLRNLCEGLSRTVPSMLIGFVGLAVNIPANYIFIFGKFGMPALGGIGCGIATALVYWAMAAGMLIFVQKDKEFRVLSPFSKFAAPDFKQIGRIFRLGFPIAAATFCEVTLFTIVALLLVPLGADIVAGHQVAINFSSMIFMIPLSLGMAVTIRVGHSIGEGQRNQARIASNTGLAVGCIIALFTATLTVIYKTEISGFYTDDVEVILLASSLLVFAAIYQVSDTVQVVSAGSLRGYKDTGAIFYITLFSYWVVGLPLGYVLCLTDILVPAMGPEGFWIGFIAGLTTAALMLGVRLKYQYGQKI